jgi:YegS/Rv2252/BmrU family lipid kinase
VDGYLLLVAAAAGSADGEAVAAAREVLGSAAPTEIALTSDPAQLDAVLDRGGGRTLVVAGGDGTLHVVVNALARRDELADALLGLIPLGTGNDLARTLGVPLDPAEAAQRVIAGSPAPLDLLTGGGDVIINAAHAGIGVLAAENAAGLKGVMGPAAYPAGAVAAGVSAEALELRVEVDGEPLAEGRPLLIVGVGNGRTVGGGTELFPDADPADGLLDVVAVADRGAMDRLRLGLATRKGQHHELDGVVTARGRRAVISGVALWNDDGEVGDEPCDGRVLAVAPAAWQLIR